MRHLCQRRSNHPDDPVVTVVSQIVTSIDYDQGQLTTFEDRDFLPLQRLGCTQTPFGAALHTRVSVQTETREPKKGDTSINSNRIINKCILLVTRSISLHSAVLGNGRCCSLLSISIVGILCGPVDSRPSFCDRTCEMTRRRERGPHQLSHAQIQ